MSAEVPEFLKPRLRLFISADIVGSTALKQASLETDLGRSNQTLGSWFSAIQGFYIEAKQAFFDSWTEQSSSSSDPPLVFGPAPTVWKTAGDEILFVKEITDHRQVLSVINCWIRALERVRSFLHKTNNRLDVKCTAWTAGFPLHNKEVIVSSREQISSDSDDDYFLSSANLLQRYYEEPDRSGVIIDYIGPAIDTGFRLAQLASVRKFIVSLDVAYIISLTMPSSTNKSDRVILRYDGSTNLKGVLGGRNYPVFWTDVGAGSIYSLEDKLTPLTLCDRDAVLDFCREFYAQNDGYIFIPFIAQDSEQHLLKKPAGYEELHSNLVASFIDAKSGSQDPGDSEEARQVTTNRTTPPVTLSSLEEAMRKLLSKTPPT